MTKRELYDRYVAFRGDPSNDETTDGQFVAQIGLSPAAVDVLRASSETADRVLIERRKRMAKHLQEVDDGLLKKAKAGDTRAASLVYARFEGWTPKVEETNAKTAGGAKTLADLIAEHG
jgi:hypothetical protein